MPFQAPIKTWKEWEDDSSVGHHELSWSCESCYATSSKNGLKRLRKQSCHRVHNLYYFPLEWIWICQKMQIISSVNCSDPQETSSEYQDIFILTLVQIFLGRNVIQLHCSVVTWKFLGFGLYPPAKSELVLPQSPELWCHPRLDQAKHLKITGKISALRTIISAITIVHCVTAVSGTGWEDMWQHELALILTRSPEV